VTRKVFSVVLVPLDCSNRICFIAFIIGDLFQSGSFNSTSKDVGSINGKDISFEDFRIKVSEVEKWSELLLLLLQLEFGIKSFYCILSSEFDKLGLRVGEKTHSKVLKADQNIGKIRCS
jgi:peptidyl-prolyl cis-trans isomerase D